MPVILAINEIGLIDQGRWFSVWLQKHFTKEGRSLANKYDISI